MPDEAVLVLSRNDLDLVGDQSGGPWLADSMHAGTLVKGPKMGWEDIVGSRTAAAAGAGIPNDRDALSYLESIFATDDVTTLPPLLLYHLLNMAPWTYAWTAWLSEALHGLSGVPGYAALVERLTNPDRFGEACSVLEVAERLQAAGITVALDVPIKIGGRRKMPDLQLQDPETGTACYGEVSVLFSAERVVEASRLVDQLLLLFLGQTGDRLAYVGRVLNAPTADPQGVVRRVAWEMMEVQRDRQFRVVADDILILAMAPEAEADRVAAWAAQRGWELGSLSALTAEVDSGERLRTKIALEAEQLPAGSPNLLVIAAQEFCDSLPDPFAPMPLIVDLLRAHSNIALLVLGGVQPTTSPACATTGAQMLATSERGGMLRRHLAIFNDEHSVPLPVPTRDKLRLAFSL